jgi:hypothetical protein
LPCEEHSPFSSWELVSVVILLCQGLIFENGEEIQETAILFFGVTSAIIMIGAVAMSIFNTLRRLLKNENREFLISKLSLSALQNEDRQQVLQIFSEEQVQQTGRIHLKREKLDRLTPGQSLEISGIIAEQYERGDEAFNQHASQLRIRSSEIDQSRISGGEMSQIRQSVDSHGGFTLTMGITTRGMSVDRRTSSAPLATKIH